MEGDPNRNPDHDVDRDGPNTDPVQQIDQRKSCECGEDVPPGNGLREYDCNHEDCNDVIDDGQGQQEDLQAKWDARTEQRQNSDHEGDIGRHGNSPAALARLGPLHRRVDCCWGYNTTDRAKNWKQCLAGVPKFTRYDFAFDLETYHEKEDGHQDVVDDQMP